MTAQSKIPHSHLQHCGHVVHGQQFRNRTAIRGGHQSQEALSTSAIVDAASATAHVSYGIVMLNCFE